MAKRNQELDLGMIQTKNTQTEYTNNMVSYTDENIEYTSMEATIMSEMINGINNQDTVKRLSFMETSS